MISTGNISAQCRSNTPTHSGSIFENEFLVLLPFIIEYCRNLIRIAEKRHEFRNFIEMAQRMNVFRCD